MEPLETDKERRGRRVSLSCRVFFFGDEDYEGEGRVVDVSTSGCRMSSGEGPSADGCAAPRRRSACCCRAGR